MTTQHVDQVLTELAARGLRATWEYPGYFAVAAGARIWHIGTANGKWEADLMSADGASCSRSVDLQIPLAVEAGPLVDTIVALIRAMPCEERAYASPAEARKADRLERRARQRRR